MVKLVKRREHHPDALVQPEDGPVVLGELLAHLGHVAQEARDLDLVRRVDAVLEPRVIVALDVAEAPARRQLPMGVDVSDGEEERPLLVAGLAEELLGAVGDPGHVPGVALQMDLPGIDLAGLDVDFPQDAGLVAELIEEERRWRTSGSRCGPGRARSSRSRAYGAPCR